MNRDDSAPAPRPGRARRTDERGPQQREAEQVGQQREQRAGAKVRNDETAATHGEGLSSGLSPSSATTCSRSAVSGSRDSWTATSWARPLVDAAHPQHLDQLGELALGVDLELAGAPSPPRGRAARSASSPRCTRPAPSRWRRRPGWRRRRGRWCAAPPPPPPTPATSAVLVTSPSIAPNTAARSQPPETSAWLWSCASASGAPRAPLTPGRPRRPARPAAPADGIGQRRRLGTPGRPRRSARELAAGAVDVLAAGVAHRRRDAGGAQPGDELALGRQRAGVPLAARRRVQRDQVDVRELPGQQLAEQVGALGLVVDVADQRVLDRVPAAGLPRVGVGGVDDLADLPARVDRHEGVAQLVVRGVQADREGDVAALLGEPADRRAPARRWTRSPSAGTGPARAGRGPAARRGSCARGRSWPAAPPCP